MERSLACPVKVLLALPGNLCLSIAERLLLPMSRGRLADSCMMKTQITTRKRYATGHMSEV